MGIRKWLAGIGTLLIGAMLLGGCAEKQGETAAGDVDSLQPRVRYKVPEAFLDTGEKEEAEDVKAKGFVYDIEHMDYTLVWSDEFEYEGLPDESKWSYDAGGSGWGNQELQYYTLDQNAWVEEGRLVIELRKEEMNGNDYTSARLVTRGKGDWKYGKVEVCAKLPSGLGTWPAIWMLPTDQAYGSWPASGEIDIMEHVGYDQGTVHGTIHTQSYYHGIGTQKSGTLKIEDVSEAFHVYALEWLPDKLIFTVDGEELFVFEPEKYKQQPTSLEWPLDQRMHLLLNIAYGGSWGGSRGTDDTLLPARMEVDYVRVYQSPQVSEPVSRVEETPAG